MDTCINIGFIGNPNCGKTTLFNAYTGARLKVANWPGVTVEKKEGFMKYHERTCKLVDLPGIYSLTSYTMEELLSRQYIMEDQVDVIVDVVDASSLERNLYLTLQLIELGKPVVLALNMMDIVEERGMEIDLHRLPEMLGIPVIPVSARKKTGLDILMHAAHHHADRHADLPLLHHHEETNHQHAHHEEYCIVYSDDLEDKIDTVSEELTKCYGPVPNIRWHAIKLLEGDEAVVQKYPLTLPGVLDRSEEKEIIKQKYDFIEEIMQEVLVRREEKAAVTDKIDRLLTNQYAGVPIFLGIMAIVFFLTFTIGDMMKAWFEQGLELAGESVRQALLDAHISDVVISLLVDGIIAGVGGVMTFLPNIFILFLALAFLEDSGYMSRVAYVMDGLMGKIGLSGRAFIPMLLGFGCSVPAIMASRTMENPDDRLKTILITPFMSCSARLPIYILFSQMFFPGSAMLAAYSMYLIGLIVAVVIALAMHAADPKKDRQTLLIELPEYKTPNARNITIYVWEKVKDYITRAGTVIFAASVILWALLNFGVGGMVTDISQSFAAAIGRVMVPLLKPAGLGQWQTAVALISGFAAKEVVISSFSVLYGVSNIGSDAGMRSMAAILESTSFNAVNAYALMVFCLLYVPCAATVATIRKEADSWKWALISMAMQLLVAWLVAVVVFQAGLIFSA